VAAVAQSGLWIRVSPVKANVTSIGANVVEVAAKVVEVDEDDSAGFGVGGFEPVGVAEFDEQAVAATTTEMINILRTRRSSSVQQDRNDSTSRDSAAGPPKRVTVEADKRLSSRSVPSGTQEPGTSMMGVPRPSTV